MIVIVVVMVMVMVVIVIIVDNLFTKDFGGYINVGIGDGD